MYKKIIAFIIIVGIMFIPTVNTQASNDGYISFTLKDAIIRAVVKNRNLENLGKTIKDMRKHYVGPYAVDVLNTERYIMEDRMKILYEKLIEQKHMSHDEKGELLMLYTALANTSYSKNIKLEPYINTLEIHDDTFCATIVKTNIDKELLYVSIENGVRQAFDSILNLGKAIEISSDSYDIQRAIYDQAEKDFKNGNTSEQKRYFSEIEMKKQKLELDKLKRNLENTELTFKKLLGVDLEQVIKLVPYKTDLKDSIDKYENYLNEALAKRSQIVSLKIDLKLAEIQLHRFKKIYRVEFESDVLELNKREMELKVVDLNNQIISNKEAVEQDVRNAYVDLKNKQMLLNDSKMKFDLASKSYKVAEFNKKAGVISKTNFKSALITFNQAKLEYDTEQRSFNYALYKMKNCCNLGPQYENK